MKTLRFLVGFMGWTVMAALAVNGSGVATEAALPRPAITLYRENPIIRPEMISGMDKGAPAGWNIGHRIGSPSCLENPRPQGGILTSGERLRSISR